MSLFDRIRAAAREVASRARFVHVEDEGLARLAARLPGDLATADSDDPAHLRFAADRDTLAYVLCVDAVNFGSGWFPVLRKPEGRSGYFTIATALRRWFETRGRPDAGALARLQPADCTRLFGQDPANAESEELMALFARSLSDLGRYLLERGAGSFEALVARAEHRGERLVELLAEMPLYRDVARYDELEVPLFKRAQITVADLALVFDGRGPGRFDDVDELTMFADNLVPHVLRCEGALRYDPRLLMTCSHPRASIGDWEEVAGEALISECPKLARTIEILEGVRARDEKALVFTEWKSTQKILQRAIWAHFGVSAEIINGDVTERRQYLIDQFRQTPGFGFLILNPGVAGYGINLIEANHVIHYSRPWNPAKENQATDRVHRRGQQKPVTIYYPTVGGTVEDKLAQLLADKSELARDVLRPTRERTVSVEDLVDDLDLAPDVRNA